VKHDEAIRVVSQTIHDGDVELARGMGVTPKINILFHHADLDLASQKASDFYNALKVLGGLR
jgi:hypothetical protein